MPFVGRLHTDAPQPRDKTPLQPLFGSKMRQKVSEKSSFIIVKTDHDVCSGLKIAADPRFRILSDGPVDDLRMGHAMTMTQDDRQTGTVKFFNEAKGYGFIVPDQGGNDVFVHVSAVQRSGLSILDNGARVSFGTEPDKRGKGPKAVDLRIEG